jgi:protein-tyrosine-phosphatase
MKIVVVCTMNQARSPFAHAVLERNFPHDEISSSGVKAILDTPIMQNVVHVAADWNCPITKTKSTNIEKDREKILAADLVICAEIQQNEFIRALGYSGDLISFEEILSDKDFVPTDPDGYSPDQLRRELGKVAALTLRAVLDKKAIANTFPVLAVIPHGISDLGVALAHAQFERKLRGAVLIDVDLRAPVVNEAKEQGLALATYDVENLFTLPLVVPNEHQILSHVRQVDVPEKYFIDPLWRTFIAEYSNIMPVVILTAPRHSRMRRLPDSYLASLQADEFSVISS